MEAGDRTELLDTGRRAPRRRMGVVGVVLAVSLAGVGLAGWTLWELRRLALDDASEAHRQLGDANRRAAQAEDQLLAMTADRLKAPPSAQLAADDLTVVADRVRAAVGAGAEVAVEDAARRVLVTIDDPAIFRDGDADLTARGDKVVDAIAEALVEAGERAIWVHGHVDDAPLPDDSTFESGWELSAARALSVARRLIDDGLDARRVAAVAFGSTRPAGKDRDRNRRVEISIEAAAVAASAMRAPARTR